MPFFFHFFCVFFVFFSFLLRVFLLEISDFVRAFFVLFFAFFFRFFHFWRDLCETNASRQNLGVWLAMGDRHRACATLAKNLHYPCS